MARFRLRTNLKSASRRRWPGFVLCLAVGVWLADGAAQPTLYRWVDESGTVHYTDQVPPGQVKQGHTKLSPEGIPTETVPPAPTEQEIELAREQERLKAEEARRIAQQKADDQRLVNLYRSIDDLVLAREGKVAAIEALSQVQRDGIRVQQERLLKLHQQLKELERAARPVPDELKREIDQTGTLIRDSYAAIIDQEFQKTAIRREFDAIMARFSRLRRLPEPPATSPDPAGDLLLGHLVSCQGSGPCAVLWDRALAYVRQQAGTQDEMLGAGLLIAFQTDEREHRRLTLAWIQQSVGQPVRLYLDLQCKNRLTGSLVCIDQAAIAHRDGFRAAVMQPPPSPP